MAGREIASVPKLRPELVDLPKEFINLFEAVVRLVDENPADEAGHPEHGTRIFFPTRNEDRIASAFIAWEDEPRPSSTVDNAGQIHSLDEIGHVNVESLWKGRDENGNRVSKFANHRHKLTLQGKVIRQSCGPDGLYSVTTLSPEAIIQLTKKISGYEDSEALARGRIRRAARWQIDRAISDEPKSPSEAVNIGTTY